MFLAGLLDLQRPEFVLEDLRELAESLLPGEAELQAQSVLRQGLRATHLAVKTPETDHAPHRGLADLVRRIEACPLLDERARQRSIAVLEAIAKAEGEVHGQDPSEIHFHEVGAVDTLIDVCGAAYAWQKLGWQELYVRPPLLGSGTVMCAHGELPVPAPATARLLLGKPVRPGGGAGERVTPTGAAIMAAWGRFEDPPGVQIPSAVGYGAGTKDPGRQEGPANLLRLTWLQTEASEDPNASRGPIWQLEVNLDDVTPQDLGAAVNRLWQAGALDVWTQSIQMKKLRPGTLLAALVEEADRPAVEACVFAMTPTFGLRWIATDRRECERRFAEVTVLGETVRIKLRRTPAPHGQPGKARPWRPFPEFDDLQRVAQAQDLPLWEVRQRALQAFESLDEMA